MSWVSSPDISDNFLRSRSNPSPSNNSLTAFQQNSLKSQYIPQFRQMSAQPNDSATSLYPYGYPPPALNTQPQPNIPSSLTTGLLDRDHNSRVEQGRYRLTTSPWEDQGTFVFQVDVKGACVARRGDTDAINGTKLLNVVGLTRGKRDGILKNQKGRVVQRVGHSHLKGVWVPFQNAKELAEKYNITDLLFPLLEDDIKPYLNPMDGHLRQRYSSGTGPSYLTPSQPPPQPTYYQNPPYSSWQTHVNPSDYYGETPISPTLADPNNTSLPSPTTNGRGLKRTVDAVYSNDSASYHSTPYSPNLEAEALSHNGSATQSEPSKRVKIDSTDQSGVPVAETAATVPEVNTAASSPGPPPTQTVPAPQPESSTTTI